MAVPKQRKTKSRRDQRRMHIFIKSPNTRVCSKCGQKKLPHVACPNCGYYKGREVIDVLKKLDKKEQKRKQKEIESNKKESGENKPLSAEDLSKK